MGRFNFIAPATANIIENISNGSANDFINTVILASNKKIFLAPAMNVKMWEKDATQINVEKLKKEIFFDWSIRGAFSLR